MRMRNGAVCCTALGRRARRVLEGLSVLDTLRVESLGLQRWNVRSNGLFRCKIRRVDEKKEKKNVRREVEKGKGRNVYWLKTRG